MGNRIKKFNEEFDPMGSWNPDNVPEKNAKFYSKLEEVKDNLNKLYASYDELTYHVSPKHWRGTGSNLTELRKIKEYLETLTPITDEEKNNPYVKKELNRTKEM